MSRIDFTPAHTTQIPARASAPQVGRLVPASRARRGARRRGRRWRTRGCRRARPGARWRRRSSPRRAARRSTAGRSRTPHLTTSRRVGERLERLVVEADRAPPRRRSRSSPAPRRRSRTVASISRATRRLSGRGSPWAMIVLSSATTGLPAASAASTSGWTRTGKHVSPRAAPAGPRAAGRPGERAAQWVRTLSPQTARPRRGSCRAPGGRPPGSSWPRPCGRRRRPAWPRRRPGRACRGGP